MNAKVNSNYPVSFFFFDWTAEIRWTIKCYFIFYFVSDPESESESEPTRSPDWESESEEPHHDSTPLVRSEINSLRSGLDPP